MQIIQMCIGKILVRMIYVLRACKKNILRVLMVDLAYFSRWQGRGKSNVQWKASRNYQIPAIPVSLGKYAGTNWYVTSRSVQLYLGGTLVFTCYSCTKLFRYQWILFSAKGKLLRKRRKTGLTTMENISKQIVKNKGKVYNNHDGSKIKSSMKSRHY